MRKPRQEQFWKDDDQARLAALAAGRWRRRFLRLPAPHRTAILSELIRAYELRAMICGPKLAMRAVEQMSLLPMLDREKKTGTRAKRAKGGSGEVAQGAARESQASGPGARFGKLETIRPRVRVADKKTPGSARPIIAQLSRASATAGLTAGKCDAQQHAPKKERAWKT